MNKTEFLQILTSGHDRMVGLTRSKGEEYSSSDDQLGNFRRLAEQTGLTMPQVWLVLFTKHLDAIRTWIKDEATGTKRERSEPIEGRIEDAILYLYLLRAIVEDGKPTIHDIDRILKGTPVSDAFAAVVGLPGIGKLYVASDRSTPQVACAAATRHYGDLPFVFVTHPDMLKGVAARSALFVFVGEPVVGGRRDEYKDKCRVIGVPFREIGLEYADDKFGG